MWGAEMRTTNCASSCPSAPASAAARTAPTRKSAVLFIAIGRPRLRIKPVQEARERNRLAHMLESADPCHGALDADAEAAVRDRSISPQVQIPRILIFRQPVLLEPALEQREIVDPLAAADDL